jgi:uncharacterized protein with HEPN domain
MKPARPVADYLRDILVYAEKAIGFVAETPSPEALHEDERTLLAVVRALEVVGEAARQIPTAFRKRHPEIPWRGMTGMRDKVIHAYFGVDVQVVWKTVHQDLPPLVDNMRRLLREVEQEGF